MILTQHWRQLILGLFGLVLMYAVASANSAEPIELRTQHNRFVIRLTGIERPERVNQLHGLDLWITNADGRPVAGATIVVTGQQRYALNLLPTSPRVQPRSRAGAYRLEGLRFHMMGEWHLVFAIEFEQFHDRATLEIIVK